jgi:hypothetical protein
MGATMINNVKLYRHGDGWLMDTSTRVGKITLPITVVPSKEEVALWLQLHPEHD